MEFSNHFIPLDLISEILLFVSYPQLRSMSKVCTYLSRFLSRPNFWYSKACIETKLALDLKNFSVNPRLRYIRELGLNHIFHAGFEVYFSPNEIAINAIKRKNVELLNYIVDYFLERNEKLEMDLLVDDLAEFGYLNEAYKIIKKYRLRPPDLNAFFVSNFDRLDEILEIQRINRADEYIELLKAEGELCKSIADGTYSPDIRANFDYSIYSKFARRYERLDLINTSGDLLADLMEESNFLEIENAFLQGKISINQLKALPEIKKMDLLCYLSSQTSVFKLVYSCITEMKNGSEFTLGHAYRVKARYDCLGLKLMLEKIPNFTEENQLRNREHIPSGCVLARILFEEKLKGQ